MKGLSKTSVYGLRPRRQTQSQKDRESRIEQLNNYLKRPNHYSSASFDWYLIKIDSNKSRNGYSIEYISRVMKGNPNGEDFAPGQQSPYYFNVKYRGVAANFYENSIIFMTTWNGVIDIINELDAALPPNGKYRDIYNEWLDYLKPRSDQGLGKGSIVKFTDESEREEDFETYYVNGYDDNNAFFFNLSENRNYVLLPFDAENFAKMKEEKCDIESCILSNESEIKSKENELEVIFNSINVEPQLIQSKMLLKVVKHQLEWHKELNTFYMDADTEEVDKIFNDIGRYAFGHLRQKAAKAMRPLPPICVGKDKMERLIFPKILEISDLNGTIDFSKKHTVIGRNFTFIDLGKIFGTKFIEKYIKDDLRIRLVGGKFRYSKELGVWKWYVLAEIQIKNDQGDWIRRPSSLSIPSSRQSNINDNQNN